MIRENKRLSTLDHTRQPEKFLCAPMSKVASVWSTGRSRSTQCSPRPLGLGSNPGEGMDIFKCIVPSRHGGTLNSRRDASPLVRLVEGVGRWEALDHPEAVLPQH
ncbi:uncharacterized protein TNCV_1590631 [Trichonephila clavipes]|nr:uncharacterized protein TNCV_1590631 [Trichonephila clavipes]